MNDNLTKLNFRIERSKLLRTKLNWKLMKLNAEVTKMGGKTYNNYIGFPAHFRQLVIQFLKMCFQFRPGHSGFWNIVIQFRALSPVFVNCNSNSLVTGAEHETAKSISSIGIHFRQSFIQNRLPDIKAHITIDEFEWQNSEVVWQNDELDPSIPYSLSGRDEFQWQLTNLNA